MEGRGNGMPAVPPHVEALRPYIAGRGISEVVREFGLTRVIKLASNENPLGASPRALEAIRNCTGDLHRYPDGGLSLREAAARRFGAGVENVIAGSGSEGILCNLMRTFLVNGDETLTTEAAFIGFQVLAHSMGVRYRTVPYRDWRYDLAALADAVSADTKLIYLANPNNPTGSMFTREEFEAFHARVPARVLIVLDEAYFEYANSMPEYPDSLRYRHDNVVTLRSFSKIYGLAGIRIGYGFAHADIIRAMLKVKLPFEPGSLAQAAGAAAFEDTEFVLRSLELNARGLRTLTSGLRELGIAAVPPAANFVMVPLASVEEAQRVAGELLRQGVIVRPLGPFGLPHCLRISTGTDEENEVCVAALRRAVARGRAA